LWNQLCVHTVGCIWRLQAIQSSLILMVVVMFITDSVRTSSHFLLH
jgi:hypothetical protein